MITYEVPKQGIYRHTVTNYDGTFTSYSIRAKIIGESDKSYYIELLEPTTTRVVGACLWARKKSVTIKEEEKSHGKSNVPNTKSDIDRYWWQEMD